jgi:hypothetical protein
MQALSISWRDIASSILIFLGVVLLFAMFSQFAGWPTNKDGWPLIVTIAAVLAAIPLVARALNFLGANRASVEALGVKLNFASAVQSSEAAFSSLPGGVVQQGALVLESGSGELEAAAREAHRHQVLLIDVEDGRAWYLTRLFALAATAQFLGSPSLLVLLGQIGGQPKQAAGSIAPADLVRAVTQKDPRYGRVLRQAHAYMRMLQSGPLAPFPPPAFNKFGQYQYLFGEVGDAVIMRILVEQLKNPDPNILQPSEVAPESEQAPPWVTLSDLQQLLGPWIRTDFVEMTAPPKAQIAAILAAKSDCVLAVRDGTFEGLVEVDRAARHIVRQLVERSPA